MACRSILCAASATTVSFLCEKEEAIESITAVTITPPLFSPNCSTLATYTSTSTCDVTATTALLQSSCVGKAECTVDVSSVLASACPDVLTGGVELTASVKCHLPGGLDTLTLLILVLYFWINLGLGATLTPDIFLEIWRNKKRAFAIGWLSQFGFMPIMSFALSHAFGLEPLRAIGAVLCGMAPGGLTSNLLVYWVDGNVALSITMSCASSVCCMFMIPLLYMLLIRTSFAAGTDISLPFDAILMPLAFAVVGVIIGVGIKVFNKEKQCGPSWRKMHYHRWTAKCGSLIGLLFLIAAFITGVRRDPELLVPSDFSREWALAAIFQPLGGLFGFVLAKLARLDMADCRAVCLETGVQSCAQRPARPPSRSLLPRSHRYTWRLLWPPAFACPRASLMISRACYLPRAHAPHSQVPPGSRTRRSHVDGLRAHPDRRLPDHRHLLVRASSQHAISRMRMPMCA